MTPRSAPLRGLRVAAKLGLLCVLVTTASAEDIVVVQPAASSSRVTVSGRIVDYTGRELTLETGVGAGIKRFPRAEVVSVTTPYRESHQRGLTLLAEGKPKEADAAFEAALDDETRAWVRRSLLAGQVNCAWWTGDYSRAASRFLPIAESDPETWYFGLMPLVWTEDVPASAKLSDARAWLRSPNAVARLLGASWLLAGTDRIAAEKVLSDLASDTNRNIQKLAQTQLWRLRLENGPLPTIELRRWQTALQSAPPELRAGPLFLLGRGHVQRQDALDAAATWLWLPFEYPELRSLSAEAQQRAAEQLLIAGDHIGARTLANEVGIRFADLPVAPRALKLLETAPQAQP
ncbi:MAG TPA: hypothetical protein VM165_01405 [Planctomycetaceae bacterium]|nr:hypothetical protein [Planctomycetaceae bacterium]